MHINSGTKYTTLQHVPSRHASLGAVSSLVADEAFEACRMRQGGPHYEGNIEGGIRIVFAERIKVLTSSMPGTSMEFLCREQKTERKTRLVSTSSSLIGYTGSTSTRKCRLLWVCRFFDGDDDDDKRLARIWEGIGVCTLILALLALALSLVVPRLRPDNIGVFGFKETCFVPPSAFHDSKKITRNTPNPTKPYSATLVSGFGSSHVFCFIVHCTYLLVIHATWT